MKDRVLGHERLLLQTLDFDLNLEEPFAFLFKCAKKALLGSPDEKKAIVQAAYNFISDSFNTTVCLSYSQEVFSPGS